MIGTTLGPLVIDPVEAHWMRDWAVLLDDPNEIHLDPAAVRRLGLGDAVINQGPLNIAYALNAVLAALPGARLEGFTARMSGNVFAGDRLTATGEVTAVETIPGGQRLHCTVRLAITGRADALRIDATLLT